MSFTKNVSALLLLSGVLSSCFPENNRDSYVYLDALIFDKFLNEVYQTYPIPGLTVGVVTADTFYVKSIGYADAVEKHPVTDSTVFFSGSFSELMVATAVLAIQENSDLLVQDRVIKHLPYFEMQGPYDEINLHHLLTHTSGIPHFNPAWDMPAFEAEALEATTRSVVYQELDFVPGSKCKRSPYNFDIAADLIAKAEDRAFEHIMQDVVLKPLQMSNSGFSPEEASENQLARPHQVKSWLKYDLDVQEIYPYTRENAGSFGLHTTGRDLVNWMKMALKLEEHPTLSDKSIDELMKLHYQTGEQAYKGYGWDILKTGSGFIYSNSWNTGGFSGDMTLFPEKQIGIVVIANTSDDFNPSIISEHIAHYLEGGSYEKIKEPAHIVMSRQLDDGKMIEEVLEWYDQQMILSDPKYILKPSLLGQLGVNLLHRLERQEDALKVFRYCVERYPDVPESHLNLVEGLLAFGHIDDAKEHLQIAFELNEQLNSPYVNFLREQLAMAMENRTSS